MAICEPIGQADRAFNWQWNGVGKAVSAAEAASRQSEHSILEWYGRHSRGYGNPLLRNS